MKGRQGQRETWLRLKERIPCLQWRQDFTRIGPQWEATLRTEKNAPETRESEDQSQPNNCLYIDIRNLAFAGDKAREGKRIIVLDR